MNKIIILTIAIAVFSVGASTDLTKQNFEWYLQNHDWVELQLKSGSEQVTVPLTNTLGIIWQYRDGAIGAEVAPMIVSALIFRTRQMLTWFSKHPEEFKTFVRRLPDDVFTDFSRTEGNVKALKKQKLELAEAMTAFKDEKNLAPMVTNLVNALDRIKVRTID